MQIWLDGKTYPSHEARISVMSHTLHYGTGVFEGIRSYRTEDGFSAFRLEDHVLRLFRSAEALDMHIPYEPAEVCHAVNRVLEANELLDAYIRPLVFLGEGSMGLDVKAQGKRNPVHLMISAWEWPSYFGQSMPGIRAMLAEHRRVFSSPTLVQAKAAGHYLNSYSAYASAKANGYDEALLLDDEGHLAEATAANLFVVKDGVLRTPFTTSALEGITRDTIITLAKISGYTVMESRIKPDELLDGDEVFLTGTAYEVAPIISVNGQAIGDGSVGPITAQLTKRYQDIVRAMPPSLSHGDGMALTEKAYYTAIQ